LSFSISYFILRRWKTQTIMEYKNYSPDVWAQIENTLDSVLAHDARPIAAFDADGTLWDTDLGEAFFNHLIDNKLVPLPKEPWTHYENMKKDPAGPGKAYLWLAQILKDVSLKTVQEWAAKSVQELHPLPYFPEQKKLIEYLISKNVDVYIVTASVKWAVDPGADILGLPASNVIGVETEVADGIVTANQKGLITHHNGKPEALLKKTNGKIPFLCAGNTMGDLHLLEKASHLRLAITSTRADDRLYKTEQELQQKAKSSGWITHRFA
jgi:phosphoserine phosphatase